jgi:hypothetical protein
MINRRVLMGAAEVSGAYRLCVIPDDAEVPS